MVGDALGITDDLSIDDIAEACGTNEDVGTTDTMMADGMRKLGIPFRVGKSRDPKDLAEFVQHSGHILLRTLTQGIKHWVVVYDFADEVFFVADPWLGDIRYSAEELEAIWKPRDYFYFEIPLETPEHVVEAWLAADN